LATCRIADWQSAACPTAGRLADCQSAIQQTASLRYTERRLPVENKLADACDQEPIVNRKS